MRLLINSQFEGYSLNCDVFLEHKIIESFDLVMSGVKCSGCSCKLEVVEFDDMYKNHYSIEEYDGAEWIEILKDKLISDEILELNWEKPTDEQYLKWLSIAKEKPEVKTIYKEQK